MIVHLIPMLVIYDQLIQKLIEAYINFCWKLLWCIGSWIYFLLMVWVDTQTGYFILIYLLTNCVILHKNQDEEFFKTMTPTTFLRLTIHIILTICYWPFMSYMEVLHMFSGAIYIVLSTLAYMKDNCVVLDDTFINQKNTNGMLMVHIMSVFILIWAWIESGSRESSQFWFSLFNYILHFTLFPEICKSLFDLIKSFVNWYQNKYRFFKRFSYCKWIIYFIIQCIRACSFIGSLYLLLYLHFNLVLYLHNDYGIQIINVTNLDKNKTVETSYISEIEEQYYRDRHTARRFTLYESIQTGRIVLQPKTFDRKCEELKYFHGEYVKLEFLYENYTGKKSYFWTHNAKVIEADINDGKHLSQYYKYRGALRFTLGIVDLGSDDFGKYTLVEQSSVSWADLYPYFYNLPFRSNMLKNMKRGVFVRKYLKSFCIIHEKPTLITVFSELGHGVVLSNFRVHMFLSIDELRYTIDDDKDIRSVCTIDSCYLTIANIMKDKGLYKQSVSYGFGRLLLVNISFCVCPEAYSRKYHTLQFVKRYAKNIAISPVKIDLKPTMNVLFNTALLKEFVDCQLSGYVYFKDFFLCLQRSSEKWNQFQMGIKKTFSLQWYIEAITWLIAFAFLLILGIVLDKCLNELLCLIFHPDLYIGQRHKLKQEHIQFDVYISFCDESEHDTTLATEKITCFVREELGYSTNSTDDVPPGAHRRRTFESFIEKSKALIIILSKEYLENDACIQEYEYTLLPLLGISRLSKDNILLLKTDTCPLNAAPLVTFTVLDWSDTVTNIRTEEEKKQELKRWLEKRLKKRSFFNIIRRICRLIRQFFDDI